MGYNPEYNKPYYKKWYAENKVSHKKAVSQRRKKNRMVLFEFLREYLKAHPCADCSEPDLRVLEFDHIKGIKVMPVAIMVGRGWSLETIKKEIAKCEVRCANCHRKRTYENIDNCWRTL